MVGENQVERRQKAQIPPHQTGFPVLKLELLVFKGQNPYWWIRMCKKLFSIHQVADDQKVTLALAYLNDVGDVWFQGWFKVGDNYTWDDFTKGLGGRFRERGMMGIVEEFNRLKQKEY